MEFTEKSWSVVMASDAASGAGEMQHDIGDLSDDALTGEFRIFQRTRGHRYSIDDLLTAYQAARIVPAPSHYLDMGCGIGSVLLMVAHKHPHARIEGIEAQDISFALAARNVERNQQGSRVTLHHGDLRDTDLHTRLRGPFDLITGTPPYQPPGAGTPSPDSQKAHARVELRGGVEAYLEAGARLLAPAGRLVVCADARFPERVIVTAQKLGLSVEAQLDAMPYSTRKGALFTVWTLGHRADITTLDWPRAEFHARTQDGGRTEDAHALRRFFDLPVNEGEAPSPPMQARTSRDHDANLRRRSPQGQNP